MIQYVDSGISEKDHLAEDQETKEIKAAKGPKFWSWSFNFRPSRRLKIGFLVIFIIALLLGGLIYLGYGRYYLVFNAKYLLTQRYDEYRQLDSSGLCEKKYDIFSDVTRSKLSFEMFNYACQSQREYLSDQYINEEAFSTDFLVYGRQGLVMIKRVIKDEAGAPLKYNEDYNFVLEHGNWYRELTNLQIDFYRDEVLNGKNKVFMDCLTQKNEAEKNNWEAAGRPADWHCTTNEAGEVEYNSDEGFDRFQDECASRAEESEPGRLLESLR